MKNRIKQLRNSINMKQEELARLLNVQRSGISKYETGKVPLTSDTLEKLSEIFNVSIDYILCKSNDSTPPGKREKPTYAELYKKQTLEELILENDEISEESKKIMLNNLNLLKKIEKAKSNNEFGQDIVPKFN